MLWLLSLFPQLDVTRYCTHTGSADACTWEVTDNCATMNEHCKESAFRTLRHCRGTDSPPEVVRRRRWEINQSRAQIGPPDEAGQLAAAGGASEYDGKVIEGDGEPKSARSSRQRPHLSHKVGIEVAVAPGA